MTASPRTTDAPTCVPTAKKLVEYELSTESLLRLAARETGAIFLKGFHSRQISAEVASRCINHPELGHYHKKHSTSVGRTYMAHVDTRWDEVETKKYHDQAIPAITDIRSLFYPHISPIDHLRLLLQEHWPGGATLQRHRGRACFVGACRVMNPDTSFLYAHSDNIHQETDAPEVQGIREQLVANAYLKTTDEGGELNLWLREPTLSESQIIMDVEGLEPHLVEAPRVTLKPEAGDLILCSSRMLHSVAPARGGHRVAMASFIGVISLEEPLVCWS